jgi:hypothetical protein
VATLVYILHKPIDLALAVVFLPFRALPPVVALVVVSALSGLLMLWVFAKFGDQDRIRRTKERIRGRLLGVRLYQHDVRIVLGLQASILRGILSYFRTSLVPMLILLLPLALILIQLNRHFAYRPLAVGQTTVLTVHTDGGSEGDQPEILPRPSDGVTVETRALREPGRGRISWRVRVDGPGTPTLRIASGDREYTKELVAGVDWAPASPLRTRRWIDQLLYPGEAPLPRAGPIAAIEVVYPHQSIPVLGWDPHWIVHFLVVSLATVLLLKRFFGVEV